MNFQIKARILATTSTMLFCVLMMVNQASAQITIGVKGVSPTLSSKESTKVYWEPQNQNKYNLTYLSSASKFSYGISFFQDFENAFVMADFLIKKTTANYRLELSSVGYSREAIDMNDKHTYISVPVIAGIQRKNVKLGLGPVFDIKAQSKYGLSEYEGFNLQDRKVNKGVQFLIGLKIKEHIHIDLRHEIRLDAEGDDYNIVGNPLKLYSHPQSFSVSVGIYL